MKDIKDVSLHPLVDPRFVKPVKIHYSQKGVKKEWEAVQSHNSVSVLIYHKDKNAFLLVKQFRPPVYLNNRDHGMTYELCAGIIDKEIEGIEIAKEEIDEECGYDVPLASIEKVTSFYTSVGFSGSHQTLYYTEIDESMKVHEGGGIEIEDIELYFLPLDQVKRFVLDETKPKTPGLMFAFYWFLAHKA